MISLFQILENKVYPEANIAAVDYDPGASEVNQLNRIKLMLSAARSAMDAEADSSHAPSQKNEASFAHAQKGEESSAHGEVSERATEEREPVGVGSEN